MATLHEPVRFVIPIAPITKKNSQQIIQIKGRPCIIPSARYKQYEREAGYYVPRQQAAINYPVTIKAVYYMQTRRRVDLTNLHESLHDLLVHHGVLADDNCRIVVSTDGSRVRYDKHNPRTEVEITEAADEPYQVGMDLSEEDVW